MVKQNYYDREKEINILNDQIKDKRAEVENLLKKTKDFTALIKEKQEKKLDLQNQIAVLDNKVAKTEIEIQKNNTEIDSVDIEIKLISVQVAEVEEKITLQKEKIAEFIRRIDENDNKTSLHLLLLNDSLASFFNNLQELEIIQNDLVNALADIKRLKANYEVKKISLDSTKHELKELKVTNELKKLELERETKTREIILKETENSEEKFQELLLLVQEEKKRSDREIQILENEVSLKLAQHEFNEEIDPDNVKLIWPVPNQGITVFFHDPTYVFKRWVGEHSGIGLRTLINGYPSNGLNVRSVSSGVVIKVITGGRYVGNAVYIAHSDNIISVYFHLSKVNVEEDEFVPVGGIIGLSGGMPGTPGAGLSTGPHLHFEVRVDGVPVNPLDYLP